MFKKFIGGMMDNFKSADFAIKGNMKVKTLQVSFKENFGLTLRVYKGKSNFPADADSTQASLKQSDAKGAEFTLKAKMKVKDAIAVFLTEYGLKVNIADIDDSTLVPKELTLGEAARGEFDKNAAWYEKIEKKK